MPFRVERFQENLEAHVDSPAKEDLAREAETYSTLKSPGKKARFIKRLMDQLDDAVEEGVRRRVMEDCGRRCITRSTLKAVQKYYREAEDIDAFLDRLNQAGIGGGHLRRQGEVIRGSYTRCYCGSVNKTKEPISSTYCYCSCGWYKALFETALERPVEVEFLGSIVQGDEACRFTIRI